MVALGGSHRIDVQIIISIKAAKNKELLRGLKNYNLGDRFRCSNERLFGEETPDTYESKAIRLFNNYD